MKTELEIRLDNVALAATLHRDAAAMPADAVMLVNSAIGTRRSFYEPFAAFFAAHGIDVVTWDYRGVGDSLNGRIEDTPATIRDWGERDLPAMIDFVRERYPDRRLILAAHSVGGQIVGMTPKAQLAERIVLIGSQSGYWRLWSGWQQLRIGFIWHVVIPLMSRFGARFPASRFGMDVDLPAGVVREWARWGRNPDYLMGGHPHPPRNHYAEIDCPLLNIWISDDEIASYAANRKLLTWYRQARICNWNLRPADLGVDRIGHYRLFRETVGPKFWPRLLDWLTARDG